MRELSNLGLLCNRVKVFCYLTVLRTCVLWTEWGLRPLSQPHTHSWYPDPSWDSPGRARNRMGHVRAPWDTSETVLAFWDSSRTPPIYR